MPQISTPFQTIIYQKSTGRILSSAQNKYIRHRKELVSFAPLIPLPDLAFFYDAPDLPVDILTDHIKHITQGSPPQVFSGIGLSKSFGAFMSRRRNAVSAATNILCKFEGGMGDQIMEAEAALQFAQIFPEKYLALSVRDSYFPLVQNIVGLKNVLPYSHPPPNANFDLIVDMHTQHISDPRGGTFGKASLYGASLGLPHVHTKAKLHLSPSMLTPVLHKYPFLGRSAESPAVGLHIRSGSGTAKCWNTEPAEQLALMLIQNHSANIFLLGAHKDFSLDGPHVHRVTPDVPWLETATLISLLTLLVAIDSGPMHLARALGTPHLILWGGTSFKNILGREQLDHDMLLDLPCKDMICFSCARKNNACMSGFTAVMVYDQATKYFSSSQ